MNILCGYHAQSVDTCKWVLENTETNSNNTTVELWREACREFLLRNLPTNPINNKKETL